MERARARAAAGPLAPWPGVLVDGDLAHARARIEGALAWMPIPGRVAVTDALESGPQLGLEGLGALWAAAVAGVSGWRVDEAHDGALIVARGERRAALVPIAVEAPPPDAALVRALESRLSHVFEGRPWALVLRKPLPPGVDLDRVVEPVRMWLVAVDRGRWDGDYAIYEDGGVSLELRLLHDARVASGPRLRVVGADSDGCIDRISEGFEAALATVAQLPNDLPWIPVLVSGVPWPLSPRRRMELLYGKILEARSTGDGAPTVSFRRSARGLLGRDAAENVAAVWWLWPDPADPLVPHGRADENPWGHHPAEGPTFPGERLAVSVVGDDADGHVPASLVRVAAPAGLGVAP